MVDLAELVSSNYLQRATAQAIERIASVPLTSDNSMDQLGAVRQLALNLPMTIARIVQDIRDVSSNSTTSAQQQDQTSELLNIQQQQMSTDVASIHLTLQNLQTQVEQSRNSN